MTIAPPSLPIQLQPIQAVAEAGSALGGAPAASESGLGGLFNRIFSGLTDGLAGAEDLTSFTSNLDLGEFGTELADLSTGELEGLANDLLTALQGNDELTAAFQGEIVAVRITVVEIESTVTQFGDAGIDLSDIGDLEGLVAAFERLGSSSEEALDRAERLDGLLAFVRGRLGLDGGDALGADLASVAALSPAVQQVASFVSVRVTQVTTSSLAFAGAQQQAPITDIGSLVLQGQPLVPNTPGAGAASLDLAHSVPQEVASLSQEVSDLAPEQAVLNNAVNNNAVAGRVSAAETAGIAEVGVANREQQRPGDVRDNRRVQAVRAGEGLEAPRGVEVYRWQVSTTGADTLTQLNNPEFLAGSQVPLDAGTDAALTQFSREASQGNLSEAARSDARIPFSERLLQAARAQVTQQASVQLTQVAENGGGTVRIKLNPEELGTIDIELDVLNGRVQGSISAERPEVLEQMARELQILKHSLETAGFSLGNEGLSLMLKQDGADNNDPQHAQNGSQAGASEDLDGTDGESHATQRWVAPDRLLDLNV